MRIAVPVRIALLCSASLVAAGCNHSGTQGTAAGFVFEPQPTAVIEKLGIASSTSPRLGMSTSGAIYLPAVFAEDGQLGFFMSHDEGDNFMGPIQISDFGARVTAHGEATPTLAFSPTQIYLLWQQEDSKGSELLAARSLSWGHTFEKPIKVTDKTTLSFSGFSSIAVAPNGDVFVVWLDGRDPQPPVAGSVTPTGTFSVYLARSTNHGASFGKNVRVAFGACPCCRPSLAFGEHGELFVGWRKVFAGDIRDMVVATSSDNGATFSAQVRVAIDNWKISGCPDSGPALGVRGNRLYVAWLSEAGSKAGIRLSYSDDEAQSFSKPIIASGDVLYPNHPVLSVGEDGTVLLAFQGRDPKKNQGWSPLGAYLVGVGPLGSIGQPFEVPGHQGSVSYPAVLAGNGGRVLVAWTETTEKGSRVLLSRGRSIR